MTSPSLPLGSPDRSWIPSILRVAGASTLGTVLVVAGGLLLHEFAVGGGWEVSEIEVTGNTHASDAALLHLADVRSHTHLAAVDLDRAVQGLVTHPWVRRAEARRVFPSTISIVVEEHEPVLLLALDRLWFVGRDGLPFKQAQDSGLDLPILTGIDPALAQQHPDLARRVVSHALDLLVLTEGHPHASPDQVSEVRFHRTHGFTLVLRSGSELLLGFDDPLGRLELFNQLVDAGLSLEVPLRVDLDAGPVAVASPLSSQGSPASATDPA